jgi:hypothetical protein
MPKSIDETVKIQNRLELTKRSATSDPSKSLPTSACGGSKVAWGFAPRRFSAVAVPPLSLSAASQDRQFAEDE